MANVETPDKNVETPEKKQNFDWIYVENSPCAYKTHILDGRTYICDNHTRGEFDRLILPRIDKLVAQRGPDDGKVRITDLGCCFGNTTLALVHGMPTWQIQENWKDAASCEKVQSPRRIPSMVTGIDLSENALKYCKRVGIVDEAIPANLNTEEGLKKVKMAVRSSDVLISAATLVYLNIESVQYIVESFAGGLGEGYMIVNFLNPFEPEKTDKMKQILLNALEFVGSRASQHRTLSEIEKKNYPDYGDWALLEIWTLRRTANARRIQMSPELKFAPAPRMVSLPSDGLKTPPGSPIRIGSKSPSYKDLPVDLSEIEIKEALVVAAAQLSPLDSHSGPKCLIRLGQLPIICHILFQLQHAGIERVVLLCGFKGEKIKEIVERDLDEECKNSLNIEYVQAGDSWHRGCAFSILEAKKQFEKSKKFLMCMADHLFDPKIIASMCLMSTKSEDALALVEKDFKGMVGLPPSAVKVQLSDSRVTAISRSIELKDAHGVDAGLFVVDRDVFERIEDLANKQAYFSLSDVLASYTENKKLRAVPTDGNMWFAVETKEALAFAVADGLKQIGTIAEDENWLSDGAFDQDGNRIPIAISGKGKDLQPGGSKWSEFTVERWRSAVYINLSYFADLYTDTINFITDIAKNMKLRGQRVTLIEVGCGTGEFIRPIADHFRLAIGLDFNENFINFCNDNIPKGKDHKMQFVCGDACQLIEEMKTKAPKHIWSDTRIVACVGNTIGIIPVNLKEQVYRQMTELAGEEGVVVVVFWNARCFGDACQNFYHANPQLCGPFAGDSIDFDTTTLTTPAPWNYRSHWTGIEEAREVLQSLGLEEIIVEERGKGVLVAARANVRGKEDDDFQLPTENSLRGVEGQGWTIGTRVAPSLIPDSGNGRFAQANLDSGKEVIVKNGVFMKDIDSVKGLPKDTMIVFTNADELEKYVKLCVAEGYTREKAHEIMEHFVHGFDKTHALLNVSAYTVNHADAIEKGLNVEINPESKDGKIRWVGKAKQNIKKGDELMIDYRRFSIPQFYKDYAKKHGFPDVRTAVITAVYGKDSQYLKD